MHLRAGQKKTSTSYIIARVTFDEKEGLQRLAKIAKVSMSDYLRFALRLAPLKGKSK